MKILYYDTEDFSEVPLKNGTHRYAEYAEVILQSYAWNDGPVTVLEEFDPAQTQAMMDEADTVVIHNSFFDRTVLAYNGVIIPVEKIDDTMVNAYAHSLPGSLDQLCEVLGVPSELSKDKEGKKLIRLFCMPRPKNQKLRRATKETHPEEWKKFVAYADRDIISMRECRKRTPRWNLTPFERKLWYLDQKINDRGIKVDIELAHAAIRAADRAQEMLAARIAKITDGKVGSATQRAKLIEYLGEEHDYALVDMKKGTVATELKDAAMPDEVRELLEIRQQASATSTAKYPVLIAAASTRDDRLRGALQFCGASRTGRWGGRIFQPQNLMRPTVKHELIDMCIAALKADCEDLIFVEMLDDKGKKILANVMEMLGNAVRGSLIAEKDKKFVISDLSNIEGRVLAWLAGEEWKVKAFAEFDKGTGHDIYVLAYARAFGVTPEVVLDDKKNGVGLMRAIGKVMELALGYGGAVGAFTTMGANYGVSKPEDEVVGIVQKWRRAHPKITSFWRDVEWACRQALRNKGEKFVCRMLEMDRVDFNEMRWLRIKLPSGRYLSYPAGDEDESGQIVYDGVNQYTKKWEQLDSYGPKFCIAAGTPVLTKKGWKAIERVTAADLVWDGLGWVKQDGLARNGVKDVISAHGVWMTPDHKILMEQGWVDASQSAGHKRAESRLPEGFDIRRKRREAVLLESSMRVRACIPASFRSNTELQESRKSCFLRVQEKRKHRKEKYYTRYVEASGIRSVAIDDRSLLYTNTPILEKLRRQRNKSLPSLAAGVREFLGGHGPVLQTRPYSGETEQQRRVFQEKLPVGNTQEAGTKQARQSFGRHALGSHDGIRSSRKIRYRKHDTALSSFSRSFDETVVFETRRKSEVFDLVNCGPRNRFVVMDKDGNPLIVHNCENIVQAVSRDILSRGLMEAEENGYEVCLHIHDEAVTETDDDPKYSADDLSKILAKTRSWTMGLPLAAAGFCCSRYRKD